MPSAGVNGDERQNLNHDCFLAFEVAFGFDFLGPLEQAEERVHFVGAFCEDV